MDTTISTMDYATGAWEEVVVPRRSSMIRVEHGGVSVTIATNDDGTFVRLDPTPGHTHLLYQEVAATPLQARIQASGVEVYQP